MTPIDWALRPLKRYAQFSGRAPRAEYWWFYLATTVVGVVADMIDRVAGSEFVAGLVLNLGLIVPWIAVTVRRLHDIDRTGWWLLAPVIPAAFVAFQATQAALAGTFDSFEQASSMTLWLLIPILGFLVACIALFVFAVLPGTPGSNRYGHDPYGEMEDLEAVFS